MPGRFLLLGRAAFGRREEGLQMGFLQVRKGVGGQVVHPDRTARIGRPQLFQNAIAELNAGRSPFAGAGDEVENMHEKVKMKLARRLLKKGLMRLTC